MATMTLTRAVEYTSLESGTGLESGNMLLGCLGVLVGAMSTMTLTSAYTTAPRTLDNSNERYLQRWKVGTVPTFVRPPRLPVLKVENSGTGLQSGNMSFGSSGVLVGAMTERFTENAIEAILTGTDESRRLRMNFVGTEHILLGLLSEESGIPAKVLKSKGISLKTARVEVEKLTGKSSEFVSGEIPYSPRFKHVLDLSLEEARKLGHNYIGSEHLLLGLLSEGKGVAVRVLENLGVYLNEIRKETIKMATQKKETVKKESSMPTLKEFGTNLTDKAKEGKLDPVIGREKQIERVIQILCRRSKNNACLIGEPGVGKTAIAEGLAYKIANGDIPETLEGKEVISLDMTRIISGTKFRGEFESRLQKLIDESKEAGNVILFIDEVHTIVGAGSVEGAIDAANILKPALARGEIQCLGATTPDEYRKHIEKDPALERRFQPVQVPEPTIDEAIQILRGLRERYELHHKLCYTAEAIVAAVKLSSQYINDRFLPDKAIDLIDEAGSLVKLRHAELPQEVKKLQEEASQLRREKEDAVRNENYLLADELLEKERDMKLQISALTYKSKEIDSTKTKDISLVVTESDIREIVSSWTRIPVQKLTCEESDHLLNMEKNLHGRVIGQEEAVKAVSRALRRASAGLQNPNRPMSSFIFAGPTGVGKTELAKALSSCCFGSEDSMVRLDMSEYMERHTVSKLIGPPPGYEGHEEGGQLTEAVRRRPYTVLLFDEIEKAHPDVLNILLQILDDGRLTDSKGRVVNFKNTLIIMTTNIGSNVIEKADSSDSAMDYSRIEKLVIEELKQSFKPEFLNRLDDMIVFKQLTKSEVKDIAHIMLKELVGRLRAKDITLQVTDKVIERVVDEGYNPSYGARELRRAIVRLLVDFMAEKMLAREINGGDSVILDVDPLGNVLVLHGSDSGSGSGSVVFPD